MGGETLDTSKDSESQTGARGAPGPALLMVLACRNPELGGVRFDLTNGSPIVIGRGSELRSSHRDGVRCIDVPDAKMSARHAELSPKLGTATLRDCGSTNGTFVSGKRVSGEVTVADGETIRLGHTLFRFRRLGPAPNASFRTLSTLDPDYASALEDLRRIASTNLAVLILGETGAGKEVHARAVHDASDRTGALVAVNCAALPKGLVEAQLFGHVKGAFSGAVGESPGLVRAADGGTLFLDEIGELPLEAQATLLRVLQEKEVLPVGGTRALRADIRLVAATNQPLEALVGRDLFRSDLYARIAGFVFRVPPLRERSDDLGILAARLLPPGPDGRPVRLRPDVGEFLLEYGWPHNVRELEQALRAAAALAERGTIRMKNLPEAIRDGLAALPSQLTAEDRALREELIAHLRNADGNVSAAARTMGKARQQLQRWIRRFNITAVDLR